MAITFSSASKATSRQVLRTHMLLQIQSPTYWDTTPATSAAQGTRTFVQLPLPSAGSDTSMGGLKLMLLYAGATH